MSQEKEFGWQYAVRKFIKAGGTLTTLDFIADIHLAAEYRRILSSDLKKHGYRIISKKITQQSWAYMLIACDEDGQQRLVA